MNEFESIRPYNDPETVEALNRVAHHPMIPVISKYLFPKERVGYLSRLLESVSGVDDFQIKVMAGVVSSVLARTTEGFTYSGIENLPSNGCYLAVSNHRDIVMDPAIVQYVLNLEGLPCTQICVGDNLLKTKLIEDLMRSNRMIRVLRGLGPRELYQSSKILSSYIRRTITEGEGSVWIAQREGRTKNGKDESEQGLMKMFDMSGEKGFVDNFMELKIIPLSISYEYEPCDARKAREILIKQETGTYVKKPKEDTHSILTGIRQKKGHVHLTIGKPLSQEELESAASKTGNERYHTLCRIMDSHIISGYRIWKTNYIAYDMLNGTHEYLGSKYLPEDLVDFEKYVNHKLGKLERRLDHTKLRELFLGIYANPVVSMKNL